MRLSHQDRSILKNAVRERMHSLGIKPLDEARKKLRGNLCVNVGIGSGGGFVNCGAGNQGRSDKATLLPKRAQTAAALRGAMRGFQDAFRKGDTAKADEHAATLVALNRTAKITVHPKMAHIDAKHWLGLSPEAKQNLAATMNSDAAAVANSKAWLKNYHSDILPDPKTFAPKKGDVTPAVDPSKKLDPALLSKYRAAMGSKYQVKKDNASVDQIESDIRGLKKEQGAIFHEGGQQIVHAQGSSSRVNFYAQHLVVARDGILTHNHPNASGFSKADISLAIRHNLKQMRAVSRVFDADGKEVGTVTVSMTRPKHGWGNSASTLANVESHFTKNDKAMREAIKSVQSKKANGSITSLQWITATIRQNEKTFKDAGLEGAFSYEVTPSVLQMDKVLAPDDIVTQKKKAAPNAAAASLKAKSWEHYKQANPELSAAFKAQHAAEKAAAGTSKGYGNFSVGKKTYSYSPTSGDSSNGIAYRFYSVGAKSGAGYYMVRHPDNPARMFVMKGSDVMGNTSFDGKFFEMRNGQLVMV